MPKLKIDNVDCICNTINIHASVKSNRSQCPVCKKYSKAIHDHYTRMISDLPAFSNKTVIYLKTRKFKCKNPFCDKKVFSEQTSYVLPYARRTKRVSEILDSLSIELTGRLGSVLSEQLLISVSSSTITRIAHGQQLPEINQPKVLGVDDWAYRKGVSYGTILIDMETSKPIDILSSRESEDLKKWLLKYRNIEIVTRDRSSSYSSAVNEICPNAIQVADRFHLIMNLSDALDRYFKSITPKIKTVINAKTNEILNTRNDEPENNLTKLSSNKQEQNDIKVDNRIDTFNKVKELQAKGISRRKISEDLGMSRTTVRLYFDLDELPPKQHPKSTNIEIYTNRIRQMLSAEGYIIKDIIDHISSLGYNGGQTQAYHHINIIKDSIKISTPNFNQISRKKIPYVKPLSTRKLSKYIDLSPDDIPDKDERKYYETIMDNISELKIVQKLVQIFKAMLKRGRGNIRRWIKFIKKSKHKLSGLTTFANGLSKDIDAVENAIKMLWSNGMVEGHVNRIKSIKRQMYGRAGFDLLRKKVILSQTG